jgi:drug/metabolite transporter (DMT)-like permease
MLALGVDATGAQGASASPAPLSSSSSSPLDPSLYLSPAGAISHVDSGGGGGNTASARGDGGNNGAGTSSDGSGPRRHLVHIPKHLAFPPSSSSTEPSGTHGVPSAPSVDYLSHSFFQQRPPLRVAEEDSEDDDDDDDADSTARQQQQQPPRQLDDDGGESDFAAVAGMARDGQGISENGPITESSALLGGKNSTAKSGWRRFNVDAEGRARRARGARAAASAMHSMQHADTVVTVSPAAVPMLVHENFQHFTPQTRRTYLRHQIDVTKLRQAQARRQSLWARLCCGRPNPFTYKRVVLASLLLLITLSSGSELVLRKMVTGNLYNYRWFLYESVCVLTLLACSFAALVHRKAVLHFLRHHGMPWKFLLLSSLLDCAHSLSLVLSVGVLPAEWGVLLPQLLVPMALLFRFFVTDGERVGRWSALGGVLVIIGALGATVPALLAYHPCAGTHTSSRSELRAELLSNVLILIVGLVPAAASAIYKQSTLQQRSMNIYAMNVALAAGQTLCGILLAPLAIEMQFVYNSGVQQRHIRGSTDFIPVVDAMLDDGSSPSLRRMLLSSSHESLSWTDGVSRNLLVHVREGFRCVVFGRNSESGDACEALYPSLGLQVLALLGTMAMTQLLVAYVMSRSSRENLLAASLSAGTGLALVLFAVDPVLQALAGWDLGWCLPSLFDGLAGAGGTTGLLLCLGALCVLVGSVVAQWELSQQPIDLDVWARLQEIAVLERLEQARRAKHYSHRHVGGRR